MKVQVEFQEPDKRKKIKRIIAREGLILFGFIGIFFLGLFINNPAVWLFPSWGYPLYLLICFIIWAVRTFREGK